MIYRTEAERIAQAGQLLKSIEARQEDLEALLNECSGQWGFEDPIYRFYHQSFKVYLLQHQTEKIVGILQALAPHLPLNDWFVQIIEQGTGTEFSPEHNENWMAHTRPIVEAFFHARYMLEMVCKYGRILDEPSPRLPSGWAAVLYLYNIR